MVNKLIKILNVIIRWSQVLVRPVDITVGESTNEL